MQQALASAMETILTVRTFVTGGYVLVVALFLVIALFFVLLFARSLGARSRSHRDIADESVLDASRVIGRFPRRTVTADNTTRAPEAGDANRKVSS